MKPRELPPQGDPNSIICRHCYSVRIPIHQIADGVTIRVCQLCDSPSPKPGEKPVSATWDRT